MKIVKFEQKKSPLMNDKVDMCDGNLALKQHNYEVSTYEKPSVKKLVLMKTDKRIFMGCWQYSNASNGGDGC